MSKTKTPTERAFWKGHAAGASLGFIWCLALGATYQNILGPEGVIERVQQHWTPWYIETPIYLFLLMALSISSNVQADRVADNAATDDILLTLKKERTGAADRHE